jgi:hypothetical protein
MASAAEPWESPQTRSRAQTPRLAEELQSRRRCAKGHHLGACPGRSRRIQHPPNHSSHVGESTTTPSARAAEIEREVRIPTASIGVYLDVFRGALGSVTE